MSKLFRDYAIERDEQGMPIQLVWRGDYEIPSRPTRAELDAEKLAEYEQIYGRRDNGNCN